MFHDFESNDESDILDDLLGSDDLDGQYDSDWQEALEYAENGDDWYDDGGEG